MAKFTAKKQEKLVEAFKKAFPGMWAKPGHEFGETNAVLWSGEDNYLADGYPAFDYYSMSDKYVFGVHKDIAAWAEKKGIHFECYDPGTYLAYED